MIQSHVCMSWSVAFEPLLHHPWNFCFLPCSYPIVIWIHQWFISASFVMACSISLCLCLKCSSQFFMDKDLPGFVFARLHLPFSFLPAFLLEKLRYESTCSFLPAEALTCCNQVLSLCIMPGQAEIFVRRNLWNFMQTLIASSDLHHGVLIF